jgi:radical SAM superfamily enzyme YgiQ (UPF0313 family)
VPSYFNAGHHLPLFMVAAYLRQHSQCEVLALDAGALNYTWKELADTLYKQYDLIGVMNDFDAIDGVARLIAYARALSPHSKIVTFGRLSSQIPEFFRQYDMDAIVASGDYEPGVAGCVTALDSWGTPICGVSTRADGVWLDSAGAGRALDSSEWVLPDASEIPYDSYDRLYVRDRNKFCGIPERRELVVPVARGCPIGCHFCEVPGREGARERRLSIDRVIQYIATAFERMPFEYVAMYAPTFTLNRAWVIELCERLIARGVPFPWKCTTTAGHLDSTLLERMGAGGCVRISVGLETLEAEPQAKLPTRKRTKREEFSLLASECQRLGIELNCFVILGLPGATVEGTRSTVEYARAAGARIRPTVYTPYHLLRGDMDERTVGSFNRQLLAGRMTRSEAHELYGLCFGDEHNVTQIMHRIPRAPALAPTRESSDYKEPSV